MKDLEDELRSLPGYQLHALPGSVPFKDIVNRRIGIAERLGEGPGRRDELRSVSGDNRGRTQPGALRALLLWQLPVPMALSQADLPDLQVSHCSHTECLMQGRSLSILQVRRLSQ